MAVKGADPCLSNRLKLARPELDVEGDDDVRSAAVEVLALGDHAEEDSSSSR
ncbi:MAG: hypothetical protein R2715_05540 [Ilumatobacteraceae bacterium]